VFRLIEYLREITDLNEEERIMENLKSRIQFQDQALHEQEVALEVVLRRSDKAARRVANELRKKLRMANSRQSLEARLSELEQ
jgi:hypothetical protein